MSKVKACEEVVCNEETRRCTNGSSFPITPGWSVWTSSNIPVLRRGGGGVGEDRLKRVEIQGRWRLL